MIFNNFKDKSPMYKIWATTVLICAIYGLVSIFKENGLTRFDYLIMFYTHASILISFIINRQSLSPQ